jgi:hypothetical protein
MISIVILHCIMPFAPMNADANNGHKALFDKRYHSERNSKSTRINLFSEKKYTKILKVLLNFNKMIDIKPHYSPIVSWISLT